MKTFAFVRLQRLVAVVAFACVSAAHAQQCGSAASSITNVAPTANLCASGVASAVTGDGPFNWTCSTFLFPVFNSVSCHTQHCHDLDGNGIISATTDGVMLSRIMLGMTDVAVTSNAVAAGAPRSSWSDIRSFLTNYCGYKPASCVPTGQTFSIAPKPSVQACIDAIVPAAVTGCCIGTLTVIVYDNPIGSLSCSGQCGAPLGALIPGAEK